MSGWFETWALSLLHGLEEIAKIISFDAIVSSLFYLVGIMKIC